MPDARLLIAVSGGADSMALLHALNLLRQRRGWELSLTVGHVHHHLHAEADTHAAFVQAQCDNMGIAFMRQDVDVEAAMSKNGGNVEAVARSLRYEALLEMARPCAANAVATAHHGDDQVETLIMRVISGSGLRGMRGLRWQRRLSRRSDVRLVRPMLATDRATVEDFLTAANASYCTDPTNADATRLRARLRTEVLPALRSIRPNIGPAATQTADQLAAAHHAIRSAADNLPWQHDSKQASIPRETLRALPHAICLAAIQSQCENASPRTLSKIVQAIYDSHGDERTYPLRDDQRIVLTRDKLSVVFADSTPQKG